MLARSIALTAALMTASTPCLAADLSFAGDPGARRTGAVIGGYFRVALDARLNAGPGPRAGLRLAMTHDYRTPTAPDAPRFEAESLELRLTGPQPTLYLAGRAVTGEQAKLEAGAGGGGRLDTIMIGAGIALVAVAGVVVATSVD